MVATNLVSSENIPQENGPLLEHWNPGNENRTTQPYDDLLRAQYAHSQSPSFDQENLVINETNSTPASGGAVTLTTAEDDVRKLEPDDFRVGGDARAKQPPHVNSESLVAEFGPKGVSETTGGETYSQEVEESENDLIVGLQALHTRVNFSQEGEG